MRRSICLLLCAVFWVAYFEQARARGWIGSEDPCAEYRVLYPTIYEQLAPFFGGITQRQVDQASKHYSDTWHDPPKNARTKFNLTAGRSLPPDHQDFPWSNYYLLKLVYHAGKLYLPGGPIPQHRSAASFSATALSAVLLTHLLNVTETYGPFPDFEFFVFSSDFQLTYSLNDDNSTFPVFSYSGAKDSYDLVLPEGYTTWSHYPPPMNITIRWEERPNIVVGRYNLMCRRGKPSLQWRGDAMKEPCVRKHFHEIANGELNHDGLLDVGLYQGVDNAKAAATPEYLNSAKFRLVLDGGSIAMRLPTLLRDSGQVILLEDHSPLYSFFYPALKPWVHYVPVGRDSYEDIFDVVKFLIKNDNLAHQIAKQGQEFGRKYLHPEATQCYTKIMLEELSALYTYQPRPLGPQAISLRDALKIAEDDRIWMRDNLEDEELT